MKLRRTLVALSETTPREWLAAARRRALGAAPLRAFGADAPCVFVLSTGRAGTQTLAALAALADRLVAVHEPDPRLYALSRLAYERWDDAHERPLLLEALRAAREPALHAALRSGRGYVETSPQATFLAPALAELVPEVRFLHLVRDPRDVVRSAMRRSWYTGNRNDPYRIVPRAGSAMAERWPSASAFEKNLWLWAETNRFIANFLAGVPVGRAALVRAEELFGGDEAALATFFGLLDRPVPAARARKRVLGQRLNAQAEGDFPEAERWTSEQHALVRSIAGGAAQALGYRL